MIKVGLAEQLFRTRYSPTALVRASYLTAVATGMDSFWLPDHLNALLPRSIATTQYFGAARLIPKDRRVAGTLDGTGPRGCPKSPGTLAPRSWGNRCGAA